MPAFCVHANLDRGGFLLFHELEASWIFRVDSIPMPLKLTERERKMRHAQAMLKRAQTRARRAEAIVTRWQKAVRDLERELVAAVQPRLWSEDSAGKKDAPGEISIGAHSVQDENSASS